MSSKLKCNEPGKPSFEVIFQKYHSRLIFLAWNMTGDKLAAEDIAMETLLKYWNKENDFRNEFAVKSFLDVSTKRACLNYLKKTRRDNRRQNRYQYTCEGMEDSVAQMIRSEMIIEIWNHVEKLPAECRKVILLAYDTGLNNEKIARQLNISVHTVKNQKLRGLDLIREKLKGMQAAEVVYSELSAPEDPGRLRKNKLLANRFLIHQLSERLQ